MLDSNSYQTPNRIGLKAEQDAHCSLLIGLLTPTYRMDVLMILIQS